MDYSQQHLDLAARLKLEPDDPMVFITLENLRLGEKVNELSSQFETWTEAILSHGKLAARQNQLIVDQGESHQKTARSYENLSSAIFQFKQETSKYSHQLSQLIDTTQTLKATSASIHPALEQTGESLKSLSHLSATRLDNQKAILGSLGSISTEVSNLSQSWNYREILATVSIMSLVALTAFFVGQQGSYRNGVLVGASIAEDSQARHWFGGLDNMEFWSQVRSSNAEQVKDCLDNQQKECWIELP